MKHALHVSITIVALSVAASAQCTITPAAPIGVVAGSSIQLSSNCGSNQQWTLTGDGSVSATGLYTAPATVFVQNSARGAQQLPNDAYVNRPVSSDPVHPLSAWWLTKWLHASNQQSPYVIKLGGAPRYLQNFFAQHADQNTPQQIWHAVYVVNYQDASAPIVQPPYAEMQAGLWMDPYGASTGGTGPDRHNLDVETLPNGMAVSYEQYQLMPDSHNYQWTPGNPTVVSFDTNLNLPLPTKFRMQVNGVTGCSGITNFNGYAYSSYLVNLVSQDTGSGGYAWRVTVTIPANTSSCPVSDFSSATLAGSSSNCPTCNTGTMAAWPVWSNTSYRSTTAGGLPLIASSIDPVRWYDNVKNNRTDPSCKGPDGQPRVVAASHQLGFTLPNNLISPANLGAATTGNEVTGGHPMMQIASATAANPPVFHSNYNLATGGLGGGEGTGCWTLGVSVATCPWFHVRFTGLLGAWGVLNQGNDAAIDFCGKLTGDTYHYELHQYALDCTTAPPPVDASSFGSGTWNGSQFAMYDSAPYGSVWRLDTAMLNPDTATSNPYVKAALWTVACYGLGLDDGTVGVTDSLNTRILSNGFYPDELVAAATAIKSVVVGPALKIVDPAGTMPLNAPGKNQVTGNELLTTSFRRTTVSVSGSAGSAQADVNLVGVTVGIDANGSERLPLIYPGFSFTPSVLVTGTANHQVSCAFETPVAGASVDPATCTVTAPASVAAVTAYKIVATSAADTSARGYASGYFVPTAADGSWRLGIGQLGTTFTDAEGNVWQGQVTKRQWAGAGSVYESPSGCLYCLIYGTYNSNNSSCPGVADWKLYGSSISDRNDAALWLAVPNGSYSLTVYGESGLGVSGAGGSVADYEVNGKVIDPWVDTYVRAGGTCKPYTHTYPVTVTNGILSFIARDRQDSTSAVYGMSPWAAITLSGGSGPPPLTFNPQPLPAGTQNAPYSQQIGGVSGGTAPYSFSETGTLPTGIALSATGLLAGTTYQTGTFPFTAQVCDSSSPQQCKSAPLSLTINQQAGKPVITTTVLPPATVGMLYTFPLAVSGGTPPYTCSFLTPIMWLKFSGCTMSGTPTVAGTLSLAMVAKDSTGATSPYVALPLTINSVTAPLSITTRAVPYATVTFGGVSYPYNFALTASGGVPPYSWSLVSGTLPVGLSLNSAVGIISGTASSASTQRVIVQVQDSSKSTAKRTLIVPALNPLLSNAGLQ